MLKICSSCNLTKYFHEFYKRKDKLHCWCKSCVKAKCHEWKDKNREQVRRRARINSALRMADPAFKKKRRETSWKNYLKVPFTVEEYNYLFNKQNGRCAICQSSTAKTRRGGGYFHVDHDHRRGIIRGLLCSECNVKVVKVVEDYSHLIPVALQYLEKSKALE